MPNKKVEFQPPQGCVPETVGSGEDFDAVCTFRNKGNGMVCLVMLGDCEMPGYRDKAKANEEAPSYREETEAIMKEKD